MLKLLLFIGISGILTSCKGLNQPEDRPASTNKLLIGKKIDKLGDGVARIFQDSKKNYWFAHNGVVKYDGECLIQFTTEDGLYANSVHSIQEDHLGNMYFDTGEGINKFNGKTIEKLKVEDNPEMAKKLHSNDLWFTGEWDMNGVYRYDGTHLYHLKLPEHELEEEFSKLNPTATFELSASYSTYMDDAGNLWIGSGLFGACRFDGTDLFWISEREMTEMEPGPSMGVRSIVQDKEGYFYFASNVNSKYRVLEVDGNTVYEKHPGIDTSQEPDAYSACISMAVDENGNFWMAHYEGGVWKYDGNRFTHYPVLVNNQEAEIFSVYTDLSGDIWLGTHNAGVWKFNGEEFIRFYPEISNE